MKQLQVLPLPVLLLLSSLLLPFLVSATIECDTPCGTNRVQLCHFNGVEFQTLCIRQSSVLRRANNGHHRSAQDYCGPCTTHKAFESTEELREAVKQYINKDHFDVDLATQYGWPINKWNVSLVTDFSEVFANSKINEDLSDWDVSGATSMAMMFWHADHLEDGGLWKWDVRNVQTMERMFLGASKFNGDLNDWDTRSLTNTMGMFWKASKFNQDLCMWDTSRLVDASRMFAEATSFDQDIRDWNTNKLQDLSYMFLHATAFQQDLAAWQLPSAVTLERMFFKVPYYEQSPSRQNALLTTWRRQWAQQGRQIDDIPTHEMFSVAPSSSVQQEVVATSYMRGKNHILHLKPSSSFAEELHNKKLAAEQQQQQEEENDQEPLVGRNASVECDRGVCPPFSLL